jgi:drug/metabolite transporter (DMT)-like permease
MSAKNWLKFFLLVAFWGPSFLLIKISLQEVGPLAVVLLRSLFALAVLAGMMVYRRSRLPLKKWWVFVILGIFNTSLPFFLVAWGEKSVPSGVASIINSSIPLYTILLSSLFLPDERLTLARIVGLLVGFGGVVVLMSGKLTEGINIYTLGLVACLVGSFFFAAGSVFARRATHDLTPEVIATGQILVSCVILIPTAAVVETPFILPNLPLTWIAIAWLGLVGSGVANLFYFDLLHAVGPTRTMLTAYILPLVAVVLGIIFLGEPLDWHLAAGGVLILIGVAVVNIHQRRKPSAITSEGGG